MKPLYTQTKTMGRLSLNLAGSLAVPSAQGKTTKLEDLEAK